jgi:hypothetical protein
MSLPAPLVPIDSAPTVRTSCRHQADDDDADDDDDEDEDEDGLAAR